MPFVFAALVLALPAGWSGAAPAIPDVCLADAERFPPLAVLRERCDFARAYGQHCEREAAAAAWSHERDWWQEASAETWRLWWITDDARIARDPGYADATRLQWLRDLRERIGAEAYYRGELPAAVPWQRWTWRE